MAGEELTKKTFGDYISVYNFKQSIMPQFLSTMKIESQRFSSVMKT